MKWTADTLSGQYVLLQIRVLMGQKGFSPFPGCLFGTFLIGVDFLRNANPTISLLYLTDTLEYRQELAVLSPNRVNLCLDRFL